MYDICCVVKVKHWVTINDPYSESEISLEPYKAAHNLIRAHARVYRLYDKDYRPEQKGLKIAMHSINV